MRSIPAAIITALALSIPILAFGQTPAPIPRCDGVEAMLGALQREYAEVPVARGMASDGLSLIVTVAPDGRTWTAVMLGPNGKACIMIEGDAWRIMAPIPKAAAGSPS